MKAVIHYSEIALKGKNRSFFENKLVNNIKLTLKREEIEPTKVEREYGRIICSFKKNDDAKKIENALAHVFGINYFSFSEESKSTVDSILKKSVGIMKKIKREGKESISLSTKRSDKKFPLTSLELNKKIGEEANRLGLKINFSHPDETIFMEITEKKTYFYTKRTPGLSGLPVSSSGKVLVMLSGGIDSAAIGWLMMKRGCKVDFLHFHALRNNKDVLNSKIKKIIDILNAYQTSSKIFTVPYHNFHISTLGKIPDKLDVVVFKNFMWRVAEEIAAKNNYKAIVTGDSIGQVASQTLDNITASDYGIRIPILRPLISYDKQEIVDLAKKIGTFEESIKDYKDCCSIISRKPATAVKIDKLKGVLSKIDMDGIIKESLAEMEVFKISM